MLFTLPQYSRFVLQMHLLSDVRAAGDEVGKFDLEAPFGYDVMIMVFAAEKRRRISV